MFMCKQIAEGMKEHKEIKEQTPNILPSTLQEIQNIRARVSYVGWSANYNVD